MNRDQLKTIQAEVERVANEHGIIPIFVSEVGSHSWGYNGPNSDYDLYVVYVQIPWKVKVASTEAVGKSNFFAGGRAVSIEYHSLISVCRKATHSSIMSYKLMFGTWLAGERQTSDNLLKIVAEYLNVGRLFDAFSGHAQTDRPDAKEQARALHCILVADQIRQNPKRIPRLNITDMLHHGFTSTYFSNIAILHALKWLRTDGSEPDVDLAKSSVYVAIRKAAKEVKEFDYEFSRAVPTTSIADTLYEQICKRVLDQFVVRGAYELEWATGANF